MPGSCTVGTEPIKQEHACSMEPNEACDVHGRQEKLDAGLTERRQTQSLRRSIGTVAR
jgi:hypothetical protein